MKTSTKRIIIAVAIIQILLVIGVLALPKVVEAIPSNYKDVIAERSDFAADLMDMVSTPYPTIAASPPQGDLPDVVIPTLPVPTATPTPEPTVAVTATPAEVETVAATATTQPSPTPEPTAIPTLPPPPVLGQH